MATTKRIATATLASAGLMAAMVFSALPAASAPGDPPDTTGGPASQVDPNDPTADMSNRPAIASWAFSENAAAGAGVDLTVAPLAGNEGSGSRAGVTLAVAEPQRSAQDRNQWVMTATLSKKGATGPVTFRLVRTVSEGRYTVPKQDTVRSVRVGGARQAQVTFTLSGRSSASRDYTLITTYEPDARAAARGLAGMTVNRYVSLR